MPSNYCHRKSSSLRGRLPPPSRGLKLFFSQKAFWGNGSVSDFVFAHEANHGDLADPRQFRCRRLDGRPLGQPATGLKQTPRWTGWIPQKPLKGVSMGSPQATSADAEASAVQNLHHSFFEVLCLAIFTSRWLRSATGIDKFVTPPSDGVGRRPSGNRPPR